jgi:phage host-nuclease inhibitor protein Gam
MSSPSEAQGSAPAMDEIASALNDGTVTAEIDAASGHDPALLTRGTAPSDEVFIPQDEPPAWFEWEYDPDLPYTWPSDEKIRWSITNDTLADWALAKYARAEQEINRLRELAAEEIARINARVEEACATAMHDIDFFGHHLTQYHSRLQEQGQAGKTYKLLHGDLTSRALPPRVGEVDVDKVQAYDPDLVRVKVEADKRKILDRAKQGEVIPGVEIVSGEVSFKPKPGKHEQPAFLPLPDESEAA